MVNCSVLMCKRRSKTSNLRIHNVSYHKFPRDPAVRQEWRTFCNRSDKWYPSKTSAICSDHFKRSDFKAYSNIKRILYKDSIPSLRNCYCLKTQEQHNTIEGSSKSQEKTSEKASSKNVAILTSKKRKSDLNDNIKTIKKLRENNRYLKNRLITLKETVKTLQKNSTVLKEESVFEENELLEIESPERNMSKYQEDVVLPTECGSAQCRTCLQALDNNSVLVDLFQCWVPPWDGMESTIAEDLAKLSNVQITQTDKYSKVICEPCCLKLQSACDFAYIVRKNDRLLRQTHPESPENIDNDGNKTLWPKPICNDKNMNGTYENYGEVEIKQEAMSEDEYDMEDTREEIVSLDIKIEPEELIQPMLLTQDNEQMDRAQSPYLELNGHVFQDEKEENQLTNGIGTNEDLLEVKEEPLSDIEDVDVVPTDLPLVCMLCCKEFNSVTGLKAHVIAQHSYKTVKRKAGSCSPEIRKKQEFVCGTCQRRFMTSTDLMVHETCHNKSVCYACSAKFDSFEQLTKHSRKCKAIANKELQKPKTLEDVKRPIIRHTFSIRQPIEQANVTFKCESCSEEFSDKYYLTIHEEIYHTKSEQYSEVNDNKGAVETEMDTLRSVFGSDSS